VRVSSPAPGTLVVGRGQPGRGAWLCTGSPACLEGALRGGALARALRVPLPEDAAARLAQALT
jgi:predicted RNA-binding protein YlxR (DUF448 family)